MAQSRSGGSDATDPARLRWLCRRGMKELDELLLRFLERDPEGAGQTAFVRLLERQDPDLYALVCGRVEPDDPIEADVLARIRRATDA